MNHLKVIEKDGKKDKSLGGKRKWIKYALISAAVLLIVGGALLWKAGFTLNKISSKGNLLGSLTHMIPGVADEIKGENEDRINVLLLGMRGENMTGGGLLADTIMVASFQPKQNRMSLVSIPRDLYVSNPGTNSKSKINAVYAYGEEKRKGGGVEDMKSVIGEISGLPIHYAVAINFKGFKDLIDAVGGVEITLEQPFEEAMQFNEEHVCDSFFTVPTGKYENKTKKYFSQDAGIYKTRIVASYPLCTAPATTLECGGNFKIPAGKQTLNGEQALCYSRSRKTSSDFERAKRQQLILQLLKDKTTSVATFADFGKVNDIFDALGNNVRTDMEGWEMKKMYELYKGMQNPQVMQRVLENTEEGMLYNPPQTEATGYILLPIGDNYDKIRNLFANIFTMPVQSDIKPK